MQKQQFSLCENNPRIVLDAYLHPADTRLRPAMLICPGGAYFRIAENEAEPVALRWHALGFNAFVLRYSTVAIGGINWPAPLQELGRAIEMIRTHSKAWSVDRNRVVICGFSAGGHLAVSYGNHWHEDIFNNRQDTAPDNRKPDAIIACYPVIEYTVIDEEWKKDPANREPHPLLGISIMEMREKQYLAMFGTAQPSLAQLEGLSNCSFINPNTPPTFLWHTLNDELVPAGNTLKYAEELAKQQVPFDLHIFMNGPHALSLADETVSSDPARINRHAANWVALANSWLNSVGLGV